MYTIHNWSIMYQYRELCSFTCSLFHVSTYISKKKLAKNKCYTNWQQPLLHCVIICIISDVEGLLLCLSSNSTGLSALHIIAGHVAAIDRDILYGLAMNAPSCCGNWTCKRLYGPLKDPYKHRAAQIMAEGVVTQDASDFVLRETQKVHQRAANFSDSDSLSYNHWCALN